MISMISSAEYLVLPVRALILGVSSFSLVSSVVSWEVLACALVRGCGSRWGQLRLRCPCFRQVKHLPSFMSSAFSLVVICLALTLSSEVSIAFGSLGFALKACCHWSFVCVFWPLVASLDRQSPRFAWTSRYFCRYFWAARTQSIHVTSLSDPLIMAAYSPGISFVLNLSRTSNELRS
jgi:hypothetical protein